MKKILIIATCTYALYLFILTITRFYNFQSEAIDVSYYRVAIDQFSHLQLPRIWDEPARFVWGDHFEPILLYLVPVYWLIKSPYVLVVCQVLLVLSGAIPLFLVAKEKLKIFYLALALVWAYLLFGGLQFGYMYGFHPILFAPFFLFWTYFFFVKKNWRPYFLFLFLSLFVKEEIAFTMIFFGVYQLLQSFIMSFQRRLESKIHERKQFWIPAFAGMTARVSATTIIVSLVWAFLCFKIIFPHFSPSGFLHFGQYGGSLTRFISNPTELINRLSVPDYKAETFLVSYGAFAFLPLLYPPSFIITIPAILEKLLSNNLAGLNGFHYSAVIVAVVLIASIESLSVILRVKKIGVAARPIFWTVTILIAALFFHFTYGYKPFYPSSQHAELIYRTISSIPKDASISAQYQIAAHISRQVGKILPAPRSPENTDYVLLDTKMPLVLTTPETMKKYIDEELIDSKKYKMITQQDGIMVWKKVL